MDGTCFLGIASWLRRASAHVTWEQVYREGSPSGGGEGDVGIRIYLPTRGIEYGYSGGV